MKTFLPFCLWSFLVVGVSAQEVALLLDQPHENVLKQENSIAQEVGRRQVDLQTLFPDGEGNWVNREGEKVSLEGFATLWIHQDITASGAETRLKKESLAEVGKFLQSGRKTVLLTGKAGSLLPELGFGEVDLALQTFGQDRHQAGLVPCVEGKLWENVVEDRGVFWFTNAIYHPFQRFAWKFPDAMVLGKTPGGPSNPMYAAVCGESVILTWNACFSPLYDHADESFRQNTEQFLKNLLHFQPDSETLTAWRNPVLREKPLPTAALRRAMEHFSQKYGEKYPGAAFLERLKPFESGEQTDAVAFATLQKEALFANPELDFEKILYIERRQDKLGLPTNYGSNSELPKAGYGNTIRTLNWRTGECETVFTPPKDFFVGDMELHFDAEKLLFSMPHPDLEGNRWRLWEISLHQPNPQAVLVPTVEEVDVDNYDACYLPDDGLVFCSTACFTGVPCVNGSVHVCNLYRKDGETGAVRQLTMEQDHDWCPTLLPNGRVLYLRWEYSDLPHGFSRILFHMNPDGTNQSEYYGSGSYYPAALFYARPLPGDTSRFVGIVTGHHELNRIGDCVIFDPSLGRKENEGAVQRIPGWGKPVAKVMLDLPIAQTSPHFLHPFPISETTFLVSCREKPGAPWRICLVDIFDNIVPLAEAEGMALLEPVPWKKTVRPPLLMDRTEPSRADADVFIADIYTGQGLPEVPRGTVKNLRVFTYEFSYQGMGAEPYSVGLDGPWDPKRILGTVPVYEDGSATFTIPAYTPVGFQPLDAEGRAIQYMRSWTIAMPGESVSCVGCHEEQNSVPPPIRIPIASQKPPMPIQADAASRGFSFRREIQPILDRLCVDCHAEKGAISFQDGPVVPAFDHPNGYNQASRFSPAYYNLRRYVRTQTKESQMAVHKPYEFHATATHLVQLLLRGHYDVQLSQEDWQKLYDWIDLNAPFYGSWGESRNPQIASLVKHQYERRKTLRERYASVSPLPADNPDDFPVKEVENAGEKPVPPHQDVKMPTTPAVPFEGEIPAGETIAIPGGTLTLVPIPGTDIAMSTCEITNEQYRQFDATHDTGVEYGDFIQFSPGEAGWLLSRRQQPVARISQEKALAFCAWLSEKTGRKFTLPTREQWQKAASGGRNTPLWFGDVTVDYARYENLCDATHQRIDPIGWEGRTGALPPWRIADSSVEDGSRVSAPVGSYRPNPYGLYDMFGNVAEWTLSEKDGKVLACGGSWYTPARWSTLDSYRVFEPFQPVFDVGFRVVCEEKK
ncbi:MAG: SUMF1/EgtB/PvdO family nonheme iron enzyme [Planctomycetia bacterium]|nr:SUMF1/EgtB/PvdO family nonheme iron enzyme [Planctomycetia bacterium]